MTGSRIKNLLLWLVAASTVGLAGCADCSTCARLCDPSYREDTYFPEAFRREVEALTDSAPPFPARMETAPALLPPESEAPPPAPESASPEVEWDDPGAPPETDEGPAR